MDFQRLWLAELKVSPSKVGNSLLIHHTDYNQDSCIPAGDCGAAAGVPLHKSHKIVPSRYDVLLGDSCKIQEYSGNRVLIGLVDLMLDTYNMFGDERRQKTQMVS